LAEIEYTAILYAYRASTGTEKGFPFEFFTLREKPVFITGNPFPQGFPCEKNFTGKTLFYYRETPVLLQGICLQCIWCRLLYQNAHKLV
jgi:hypothetical protein